MNQWRAYGDDGKGCALGIKVDDIKNNLKLETVKRLGCEENSIEAESDFCKCNYDKNELKRLINKKFDDSLKTGKKTYPPEIAEKMKIFTFAPFAKDKAYESEAEYRFLYIFNNSNSTNSECQTKRDIEPLSININSTGNPIIKLSVNFEKCLESITLGPCVDSRKIEKLKYWLRFCCLSNTVDLKHSAIPYRGK